MSPSQTQTSTNANSSPTRGLTPFSNVIFFFKQKTAYEMRISDWSSDVCSSDLPFVFYLSATTRPGATAEKLEAALGDEVERMKSSPITPDEQIGRASCRERVCQYV